MSCNTYDFNCVAERCSNNTDITELSQYWQDNDCPGAYFQVMNSNQQGIIQYSSQGLANSQSYVTRLFINYLGSYDLTDNTNSPRYNLFQNQLINLCLNDELPGICGDFLTSYCSSVTREQANNDSVLASLCGCYIPPDPNYLQYTLATPECLTASPGCSYNCTQPSSQCVGQPSCDPLCHRNLSSQKSNPETGKLILCGQSICVIDNISINLQGSSIGGGNINFNTLCPGCLTKQGCTCIVSGVNISQTLGQAGITENFNSFCGQNSVCLVEDNQGNILSSGQCPQFEARSYFEEQLNIVITSGSSTLLLLSIVFLLLFLVIMIYLKIESA
jgi:hypothetical protein